MMEAEKRKLIINEIGNWRRSKLLPEQYCDFLLNLYMENPSDKRNGLFGLSPGAVSNSSWKIWLLVMACFGFISLSVLNFNSFPFPMQIGVSFVFLFACYFFGALQRGKAPALAYLLFGTASLALLWIGLHLIKLYHLDRLSWVIVAYLFLVSLIWLFTGIAARMGIFHFCGWVGIVLSYGWILGSYADLANWSEVQLSWLPFSVLFAWIGWLCHHGNKGIGVIFFLLSVLLWFAPEVYGFIMQNISEAGMQISLVGKIIAAGVILFLFRKKWTEWVA
jgi:hypothetical protein